MAWVQGVEVILSLLAPPMSLFLASKFQQTDIVIMGIILIGVIGYTIDIMMRRAEGYFVPWKGKD